MAANEEYLQYPDWVRQFYRLRLAYITEATEITGYELDFDL
ncbi:hypothetical protein SDC9_204570 [bioreactor metagenome]|uniref:Uncharacterized protein n=1 Tax=bioreactor metagenome TaxID=1076179 RepID=A0A645J0E4_9ZZZZ